VDGYPVVYLTALRASLVFPDYPQASANFKLMIEANQSLAITDNLSFRPSGEIFNVPA